MSLPSCRLLAAVAFCLAASACRTAPAAPLVSASNPELVEEVQAPTLPLEPVNDPLPVLGGSVPLEPTLRPAAALSSRVQMRLLLVSPTADNPGLAALEALCDQVGVPCDRFVAGATPLTEAALVAPTGEGRYQGIFLTDNQLVLETNGTYASAFDADEWNLLWTYARDYGVRQVSLYTFPGTFPESYGVGYAGAQDTTAAPHPVSLTAAGEAVFGSLKKGVSVPVRYAYSYLATLTPDGGATPLIQDAAGNTLAVTSTSPDGRERLALTVAHNPYLLHTQLFGYDLLRWVTKGVFLGQRQFYLGIDQDDWFSATDKWDAGVRGINGTYRMSAQDVAGVVLQQRKLRSSYPFAKDFAWTMAFNGANAVVNAPRSCNVAVASPDPLTSLTRCHKNEFFWVNHTWNHAYMDAPTGYDAALGEIAKNTLLALRLGLVTPDYGVRGLVTGDVSGLGWYAPGGPDTGPKVDFGLDASNREFLRAARNAGVRYLASNMSVRSHEPTNCWGCGIAHPLEPRILLVPRWPTNLFATPTTPTDMMDAYNLVYGPNGSSPYFPRDLTYDEYLDFEADIALYHLISGSPYQHYQHVGNLREYTPGRSLAYDWTERLLAKYSRYYDRPVLTLDWDDLGRTVAERTSFRQAGVSGTLDTAAKTLSVTSAGGGTLFLTGGPNAKITKATLRRGETRVYRFQ